ncbi:hypothetical protein PVAP13_5NG034000 [Panicum virgatum]|uniref:Uncharacterized protein n=1 Tax=Panicum virgatum TaxID=38727 RepID=A0A8T0RMP2_PANVG|nr:hypothetical protein PVAP13_5NG034000 [Panicum virgatum]
MCRSRTERAGMAQLLLQFSSRTEAASWTVPAASLAAHLLAMARLLYAAAHLRLSTRPLPRAAQPPLRHICWPMVRLLCATSACAGFCLLVRILSSSAASCGPLQNSA